MRYTLLAAIVLTAYYSYAQVTVTEIDSFYDEIYYSELPTEKNDFLDDFTYERLTTSERKPVAYKPLREADVVYATRIHRVMDVQEKQNVLCMWKRNPLANVIFEAAEKGELIAYKNDSLSSVFRADNIIDMFATKEVIKVPDWRFPGEFKDSIIYNPYNLEDVKKWRIIEDWVFDKNSGTTIPRIVAMAPIMNLEAEGQKLGEYEGFYISWKEARRLLVNEETYNRHNEAGSFTYYDFFEARLFSSNIVKEPNVRDLPFGEYDSLKGNPLAQLLEGERVKKELMDRESDWWQD